MMTDVHELIISDRLLRLERWGGMGPQVDLEPEGAIDAS